MLISNGLLVCLVWLQVLTFDPYGVSGHINHRCAHEGVRYISAG